jgi:sugar O-acyltransferase (sialic acid O-acetyltransferase NeuD family)
MKNNKIAIIGAGGFGSEIFSLLEKKTYNCIGFIDKEKAKINSLGPIIGDENELEKLKKHYLFSDVIIAIGDVNKREIIYNRIKSYKLNFPLIVDSSLKLFSEKINKNTGVLIYPNVVIMNNCKIGKFVLINSGVTIGHDVNIGDFCNINPGAHLAGKISIGNNTLIGIGSVIKEGVNIGNNVIVGAGSVVINDVLDNKTVYGVPAKEV